MLSLIKQTRRLKKAKPVTDALEAEKKRLNWQG